MLSEYIWEITPISSPLLKRKCNRCNSNSFYCSEKFRINAQKKTIDIWLIYKCIACENTFNMTLFSRTKTESINKNLFHKLSKNDKETAWIYAFSPSLGQKNKVEIDFSSVQYEINYYDFNIHDILERKDEFITIKFKYLFEFNLKTFSVIKDCLNISLNRLNQLVEKEVLSMDEKNLNKKTKICNDDIIRINIKKLRAEFKESSSIIIINMIFLEVINPQ